MKQLKQILFLSLAVSLSFAFAYNNTDQGVEKPANQKFIQYKISGLNNDKPTSLAIDSVLRAHSAFMVSRIDDVNNYGFGILNPNETISEAELNTILADFNCSVQCFTIGDYGVDAIVQPYQCQ